jgi:hypothetical protein
LLLKEGLNKLAKSSDRNTDPLQDHISVFVLNGFEELDSFLDLDESELDYLGIHEAKKRSTILAAVEWLQDTNSG